MRIHAAMKADVLLEEGDMGGAATWRRVIKAIEELLATGQSKNTPVH